MVGLQDGEKPLRICNCLHTIPSCDGQTDILQRHSPGYAYASRGKKIAIFRTVCEIHRYIGRKRPFLPRDAMHSAEYAIAGYLSVCLSVCLSDAGILSNWLNISLNIFHHRVTTLFYFFRTKRYKNISTGGTKNRIFDRNLSVCRK